MPIWQKYPHIEPFKGLNKGIQRTVWNREVYWQPKRDGSNVSLVVHDGQQLVYTRNQLAEPGIQIEVKKILEAYPGIWELAKGFIVYGEFMRSGKSPAHFETHDEPEFVVFDMYDCEHGKFLEPCTVRDFCTIDNVPFVPVAMKTIVSNSEDMKLIIDSAIETAHAEGIEGYVAKWFVDGQMHMFKAKVEQKYPRNEKSKKHKSKGPYNPEPSPEIPELEYSEVTGCIARVHDELGNEKFAQKECAMPAIAKQVRAEEAKHGKKARVNIYEAYLEYLANRQSP